MTFFRIGKIWFSRDFPLNTPHANLVVADRNDPSPLRRLNPAAKSWWISCCTAR